MSDAVSAVRVRGLVKNYGSVEAVRGIDLDVPTGETYGFLGPNGAGKSTTIEMLCTIRNPTSGQALVAGYDVVRQRDEVRRRIGLVFQAQTLDLQLTAEQNPSSPAAGVISFAPPGSCCGASSSGSARTAPGWGRCCFSHCCSCS